VLGHVVPEVLVGVEAHDARLPAAGDPVTRADLRAVRR